VAKKNLNYQEMAVNIVSPPEYYLLSVPEVTGELNSDLSFYLLMTAVTGNPLIVSYLVVLFKLVQNHTDSP
jgi:hypothetical protein